MAISGGSRSRLRALSWSRSEEHTSELQSQSNLVCRLLLEKKKKHRATHTIMVPPPSKFSIHCYVPTPASPLDTATRHSLLLTFPQRLLRTGLCVHNMHQIE